MNCSSLNDTTSPKCSQNVTCVKKETLGISLCFIFHNFVTFLSINLIANGKNLQSHTETFTKKLQVANMLWFRFLCTVSQGRYKHEDFPAKSNCLIEVWCMLKLTMIVVVTFLQGHNVPFLLPRGASFGFYDKKNCWVTFEWKKVNFNLSNYHLYIIYKAFLTVR